MHIQDEFLKQFLKQVKKNISKGNFTFLEYREKNSTFLKDNGLTIDDVKEAILQLSPKDKPVGPEGDRDGHPGYIYKFKINYLTDEIIYIKIRFAPPDEIVCISFHNDEK